MKLRCHCGQIMHIEIIRRRRCLRSALNRSSGRAGRESAFSRFARIKNHREQNALPGDKNSQIVLVSRPHGEPTPANFKLVEAPMPTIGEGQILLKTKYLSLDPYMRGRMSDARSYVPPFAIGDPLGGGTVSEVVASNNPRFSAGDILLALAGWQEYSVSDGNGLHKLDPKMAPVSTALGVPSGSRKRVKRSSWPQRRDLLTLQSDRSARSSAAALLALRAGRTRSITS